MKVTLDKSDVHAIVSEYIVNKFPGLRILSIETGYLDDVSLELTSAPTPPERAP